MTSVRGSKGKGQTETRIQEHLWDDKDPITLDQYLLFPGSWIRSKVARTQTRHPNMGGKHPKWHINPLDTMPDPQVNYCFPVHSKNCNE